MAIHSFNYIDGKPFIKVRFDNADFDVQCLVDSGADFSIFSAAIGEAIGIDFSEWDPLTESVSGLVSEITSRKWRVPVTIHLGGVPRGITIEAIFVDSPDINNILGRKTFFDKFDEIIFDEKNSKLTFRL